MAVTALPAFEAGHRLASPTTMQLTAGRLRTVSVRGCEGRAPYARDRMS